MSKRKPLFKALTQYFVAGVILSFMSWGLASLVMQISGFYDMWFYCLIGLSFYTVVYFKYVEKVRKFIFEKGKKNGIIRIDAN